MKGGKGKDTEGTRRARTWQRTFDGDAGRGGGAAGAGVAWQWRDSDGSGKGRVESFTADGATTANAAPCQGSAVLCAAQAAVQGACRESVVEVEDEVRGDSGGAV